MNKNKLILFVALALSVLISGCKETELFEKAAPVDQLSGKTVGVMLAWESDYALSPRKDLTLIRYDGLPDMVMALRHDKIDAIAIDALSARIMERMVQGIKVVQPSVGKFGYCAGFNERNRALLDDYNEFVAEYVQTEAYADLQRRVDAFEGIDFEEGTVRPTGTGKVIRVAYPEGNFPCAYWDTTSDSVAGFDLEPLITWANDRNYTMEITGTTYSDMMMGLTRDRYDVAIGAISELYAGDMLTSGNLCSTPVVYLNNYFLIKTDNDMSASSDFFETFE